MSFAIRLYPPAYWGLLPFLIRWRLDSHTAHLEPRSVNVEQSRHGLGIGIGFGGLARLRHCCCHRGDDLGHRPDSGMPGYFAKNLLDVRLSHRHGYRHPPG